METDQIIELWLESLRSEHTREDYAFDIQRLAYRQQPQVARIVG